jgi:hypothetical protein
MLREEHSLSISENRVLTRIFHPKIEEVTGGWIKLHSEEIRNLCLSPDIVRVMKSGRMIYGQGT